MYLLDAIRDGIVIAPKIVSFNYELENSMEYKEIIRLYEQAPEGSPEKLEFERAYKKMKEIIDTSKSEGMKKIIENNLPKQDGRYIVFLPKKPSDFTGSTEDFVKMQIEEFKKNVEGIDADPEVHYLLSNRSNSKENITAISQFETSNSSHLKLIFAIDMLNEGVHVDGIDGCFMLRPIGDSSKIMYLQQIGRCIYSRDPKNPPKDVPVIFDCYNNYMVHNLNKDIQKGNITSDLQRLQSIVNWCEKHEFHIPDINSEDTEEARKAIILKNTKEKYGRYINGIENSNISEAERYRIQRIIELGYSIDLWSTSIPDRIIPPGEDEIDNTDTFKVTGDVLEFFDTFREVTQKRKVKLSKTLELRNIIETLEILTENGVEISNKTITEDTSFKDIYDSLPEKAKQELAFWGTDESFDIYSQYQAAKERFYYRSQAASIYTQYDLRDLRRYGLFEPFKSSKTHKMLSSIDENNFVIHGPYDFMYKHINTGSFYNEDGKSFEDLDTKSIELNRIRRKLELFKILAENDVKINNEEITEDIVFEDVYGKLPETARDKIDELKLGEDFDLYEVYQELKETFYYRSKYDKFFAQFDIEMLRKMRYF